MVAIRDSGYMLFLFYCPFYSFSCHINSPYVKLSHS